MDYGGALRVVQFQGKNEYVTIVVTDMTLGKHGAREIDAAIRAGRLPWPSTFPNPESHLPIYAWHLWPGPSAADIAFKHPDMDPKVARERAIDARTKLAVHKRKMLKALREVCEKLSSVGCRECKDVS
jgi:hypothetical protein